MFHVLDPLQPDYRLITDTFGDRLLKDTNWTLDDQKDAMTLAMAEPWNQELVQSIERIKENESSVVAAKRNVLRRLRIPRVPFFDASCGAQIWKR